MNLDELGSERTYPPCSACALPFIIQVGHIKGRGASTGGPNELLLSNVHHGALSVVADGDLLPLSLSESSDQTCLCPVCGLELTTKWSLVC